MNIADHFGYQPGAQATGQPRAEITVNPSRGEWLWLLPLAVPSLALRVGNRRAFTLFELVLVLAVLVVLTALIYPSFEGMYAEMRVSQATDQVRACWAEARSRAMNEGRPYRFAILTGHGNFRLAPDSPDYWSGSNQQQATPVDATDWPLVVDDALPSTIRFLQGDSTPVEAHESGASFQSPGSVEAGGWQTLATFLPDGTAREDVELILYGPHARPMLLRLRGLTGTVSADQLTREALASGAR